MKKFNAYLVIILLTVLIIPSVAFASWWNPFSWNIWNQIFNKQTSMQTPANSNNQVQPNNQASTPAVSPNNQSACAKISAKYTRQECYTNIFMSFKNPNDCQTMPQTSTENSGAMSPETIRDTCYTFWGERNLDKNLC